MEMLLDTSPDGILQTIWRYNPSGKQKLADIIGSCGTKLRFNAILIMFSLSPLTRGMSSSVIAMATYVRNCSLVYLHLPEDHCFLFRVLQV